MALLCDSAPDYSCELVNAIQNDFSDAEVSFRNRFEKAIKLLAKRRTNVDFEIYADAAIAATLQAVRCFAIKRDEDLPSLICQQLDAVLTVIARDRFCAQPSILATLTTDQAHETLSRLLRCSAKEREILRLFYIVGEDEVTICRTQNISLHRLRAIRVAVKKASGQS